MKKLIVLGGGFAGSFIARKLEEHFDVTLIDSKDYFEFTPGVLRTIVEPEHIKKIQILHTHYLKRAKVVVDCATEIYENFIKTENGRYYFDYLVICSGSKYTIPIKEQNIVLTTRANSLRNCYNELCRAKSILIIGGGLVGVELAAEIIERYNKNLTIIHAEDRLIERNHIRAVRYAEKFLLKRKVKIIYKERVISGKGKTFKTNKGTEIKADMAFWCTGITPNFEFMKNKFEKKLNSKGQIKVNKYLQVIGYDSIFCAGDVTDRAEEKTAQNAKRQAKLVVSNILALENNERMKEYHSGKTPLVISLGKHNGIISWGRFVFTGLIPGLLKTLIEKRETFLIRR